MSQLYSKLQQKSTKQHKSELSFGKQSLPATAPRTQNTHRNSKQGSLISLQQLICSPEMRRNKTVLSDVFEQFRQGTGSKSNEKKIDLVHMNQNNRIQWLSKQSKLTEQPIVSPFNDNTSTQNRVQYSAKATNYNNFVKRYASTQRAQLLEENLEVPKPEKRKILTAYGPKNRQFVYHHLAISSSTHNKTKSIRIFGDQQISQNTPIQEVQTERKCLTTTKSKFRRTSQISQENREKFSNYYKSKVENLKNLKDSQNDLDQVYKRLGIQGIEYNDLEKVKKAVNLQLVLMLKEEEILLKQQQVEECEKYSAQELIIRMQEIEKLDTKTSQEYRRRAYLERNCPITITETYRRQRQNYKKFTRSEHLQGQQGNESQEKKIDDKPFVEVNDFKINVHEINEQQIDEQL